MTPQEASLRDMQNVFMETNYSKTYPSERGSAHVYARKVVCTPVAGEYGCIAYWALALEGTPVKGLILMPYSCSPCSSSRRGTVVDGYQFRPKVLSETRDRRVRAFIEKFLPKSRDMKDLCVMEFDPKGFEYGRSIPLEDAFK